MIKLKQNSTHYLGKTLRVNCCPYASCDYAAIASRRLDIGESNRVLWLNVHSNERMVQGFHDLLAKDRTLFSLDGGLWANA